MNEPLFNDLAIRPAADAEFPRAFYLFRGARVRPQARLLVAVRSRPVERFVAAAAWWPAGRIGCFQLASQPGVSRAEVCARLFEGMAAEMRDAGLESMQYGEALAEGNEWIIFLQDQGFTWLRTERFFEVAVEESWTRTMETFAKHQARIPADWRTEPIRKHAPEVIFEVIAPHRLMPPPELIENWRADLATGFDLDLSSILFAGERAIGTLLVRKVQDSLYVDVRVVTHENQLLRALGNVLLFKHMALQRDVNRNVVWLKFRGGATEHRETANLALRMGGREMSPRHVYAKTL